MRDRLAASRSWLTATAVACGVGALMHAEAIRLLAVAALVAVMAAFTYFLWLARSHRRLTRALVTHSTESELAGTRVRLGSHGRGAFVAGLTRPEIFCDHALVGELSDDEQLAVSLHERAHQLAHDPLRILAVATLAPVVGRFAAGRGWLERVSARREIAADRYALDQGVQRAAIASSLLKVSSGGPTHAPGFASAAELRIQALLGDDVQQPVGGRWRAVAVGAGVGVLVCAFVLPQGLVIADTVARCCP